MDRYVPEFVPTVFKRWGGKAGLVILQQGWLPVDLVQMSPEQIVHIWKEVGIHRVGKKAPKRLVDIAQKSIGLTEGLGMARKELQILVF